MSDHGKDYSKFDKLSTEELEDLLRNDFESDRTSDMDAVLYMMEVIAQRKKEAGKYTHSDVERAWKSFNENYRHNTQAVWDESEDDIDTPSKPVGKAGKSFWKRMTGVAAAVVIVVGCALATSTDALSFNLWQIVAQWTSETFGFSQEASDTQDTPTGTTKQYNTLQEALDAYDIKEQVAPTWVPDEYFMDSVEVIESPEVIFLTESFHCSEKYILIKIRHFESEGGGFFEKDDSNIEIFEFNRIKHYIMSNLDCETVVWTNGTNECSISASVSRDELKRIIQSIYE